MEMPTPKTSFMSALLLLAAAACGDDAAGDSGTDGGSSSSSTGADDTTGSDTTSEGSSSTGMMTSSSSGGDSSSTSGESSSSTGDPLLPEIEVEILGASLEAGDSFALSETVDVGAEGSTVEVTVSNTGTGDLTLGDIALGDAVEFVLNTDDLETVVAPGASTSFFLTFAPANGGMKTAVLTIPNDDADEAEFDLTFEAHTTPNTYRTISVASAPPPRFNASMTSLGDGRLLLFGGRTTDGSRLGDTWVYDVAAETWTELSPAMAPSPRDTYAMARDGGTVVLFGGLADGNAVLGGTWVFDIETEEWSSLMLMGGPTARFRSSMAAMGDGRLLLYGGRDAAFAMSGETWTYDVAAGTWTQIMPKVVPAPRFNAAMAFDTEGAVTMFGGYDLEVGLPVEDTWRYDVATNQWALVAEMSSPGAWFAQAAAHYAYGTFVTHGGKFESCCQDPAPGTWQYDPVSDAWTELTPASEPTPRFNAALAYVEGTNKSILFGGNLINIGTAGADDATIEYVGPRP